MRQAQEDFFKVARVITSCRTLEQLDVARRMAVRFNQKYQIKGTNPFLEHYVIGKHLLLTQGD